jgi:peroxiredoxin
MWNHLVTSLLAVSTPQVGDLAPDFSVAAIDGKPFVLSERLRRGPVVLAFFPKAFTAG